MLGEAELRALIDEATTDAYDDEEQLNGFFSMIADNLALPFEAEVLGEQAQVIEIGQDQRGRIVVLCERKGKRKRIGILDLTFPSPPPEGAPCRSA